MFTSISFHDFRGFTELKLDGLQRVNLIVGKNNAGKTSLLEGIGMLADPRQIGKMPGLLRANIGNVGQRYFRWLVNDAATSRLALLTAETGQGSICIAFTLGKHAVPIPNGLSRVGGVGQVTFAGTPKREATPWRMVSVQHRNPDELTKMFGQAVRQKGGEAWMEQLLRTVEPRIQKVRVDPAEDGNLIVVDVGLSEMVPLSQAGQGLYRLVTIFSELIGGRAQLCLIDEIENGIHHTAHEQVWTGIAEVAAQLDVQVFATTHSGECLEAAHEAFAKRPSYDLGVIQLFRVEAGVQGRVLDRKHIEAAISGDIELR